MIRNAAERILGFPMTNDAFRQASLTPKLGGLGLRKATEHADFAYGASWHESQWQAKESWVRPDQVPESHVSQSAASLHFDKVVHAQLVSDAPSERERQRLLRVAQPHANAFITAVPSEEDGKGTLMKPRIFSTLGPTSDRRSLSLVL